MKLLEKSDKEVKEITANFPKIVFKKICIASDHAGFNLKETIKDLLIKNQISTIDLGPYSNNSVDYPDFAHPVAYDVENNISDLGILICGTGNGVAMTANKYKKVRAALCWNEQAALLAKKHNNANIICIPARFISKEEALQIIKSF